VVQRLEQAGVPVLTTQDHGALRFDLRRPDAPLTGVASGARPHVSELPDP